MSDRQTAPNLQVLEDAYEILGELRIGEQSRMYIAKQRDGGADVLISVVTAPKTGENNALNHFAADTQLLSKLHHPQIPQVIEGRWVGKAEFAVITERRTSTTLGEQLARGEKFTPPRIATILHEVSAILDWARDNGVVHRGVTLDTLAFEQGTNRVLVSLAPTPIPMEGVPDIAADAQTIGLLAWAMLTGEAHTDDRKLGDVRPDLAKRVADETDSVVRARSGGEVPDVPTFLAVVATADALKAGEVEIAEIEAGILEARRAELEAFQAEQEACALHIKELEEQLANERAEFERRMADEEAELASVKAAFASLKANEEAQMAAERAQFEQEHRDFEDRSAELEARHAELDKKFADLAALRAEETKRIDAAIAAAVEKVALNAAEAAKQAAAAEAARAEAARTAAAQAAAAAAAGVAAAGVAADVVAEPSTVVANENWKEVSHKPAPEPPEPWVAETVREYSIGPSAVADADAPLPTGPRWMVPSAVGVGLIIIATLAVGLMHRAQPSTDVVKVGGSNVVPTAPTTDIRGTPQGGFLTQSAGGVVARHIGPPLASPGATTAPPVAQSAAPDSATKAAVAAAAAEATSKPKPHAPSTSTARSHEAFSAEADAIQRADSARRDSIARRRDRTARGDSTVGRDTTAGNAGIAPRRDSTARRDSTTRRDTTAKRDSTRVRPDTLR